MVGGSLLLSREKRTGGLGWRWSPLHHTQLCHPTQTQEEHNEVHLAQFTVHSAWPMEYTHVTHYTVLHIDTYCV